ncbi:MAG: cobalamin biosynthesis protein CbiD [Clostridium butyricum]|nr:cobalamin biosynthesis protein CbiD [Clostridium butyricum]
MFEMYVESEGKKLRCGYTTGSCSAGAAKAATFLLYNEGKSLETIAIESPKNITIDMPIEHIERTEDTVECTILKFSGDDPDATSGIEIKAKVRRIKADEEVTGAVEDLFEGEDDEMIYLKGGEGVGIVTKEGLFVKKGEPAINPVPRKMIRDEVLKVLPDGERVEVTISVPKGREIAEKTFNPRLGIVDGISILGTTGIVYPMSEDALKASIKLEINQRAINKERLVLTFGNLGERFCKELGFESEEIVICSNYIGFALECCQSNNIKSVIVVGHIGKMSKIAYGCFNTHSRVNGVRLEVFALELALLGYDLSLVNEILEQKTCEGAVRFLGKGYDVLYRNIGRKIVNSIKTYVHDEMDVEAVMYYGVRDMEMLYDSREDRI